MAYIDSSFSLVAGRCSNTPVYSDQYPSSVRKVRTAAQAELYRSWSKTCDLDRAKPRRLNNRMSVYTSDRCAPAKPQKDSRESKFKLMTECDTDRASATNRLVMDGDSPVSPVTEDMTSLLSEIGVDEKDLDSLEEGRELLNTVTSSSESILEEGGAAALDRLVMDRDSPGSSVAEDTASLLSGFGVDQEDLDSLEEGRGLLDTVTSSSESMLEEGGAAALDRLVMDRDSPGSSVVECVVSLIPGVGELEEGLSFFEEAAETVKFFSEGTSEEVVVVSPRSPTKEWRDVASDIAEATKGLKRGIGKVNFVLGIVTVIHPPIGVGTVPLMGVLHLAGSASSIVGTGIQTALLVN